MAEIAPKRSKRNRASAKAAGTWFEGAVAEYLDPFGGYRRARAGAKDLGDIHLHHAKWLVLECKNAVTLALPAWWREAQTEAANAGVPFTAVVHKRSGTRKMGEQWVTMDLETFSRLLSATLDGRYVASGDGADSNRARLD